MSFILEGLKKSEQKRTEGEVPNLQTLHRSPAARRRRKLWPVLLCSALLLNAVVLVWWLRPWQAVQEAQPVAVQRPVPPPIAPDHAAPPVAVASVPVQPKVPSVPVTTSRPVPPPIPKAQPPAELIPVPPPVYQEKKAAPPSPLSASSQRPTVAVTEGSDQESASADTAGYPSLDSLPASIRQQLPAFNFSLHYYSEDPEQRMVRLNGRILREGQELSDGLLLSEITSQGAIFSYHGYDFEVSAF